VPTPRSLRDGVRRAAASHRGPGARGAHRKDIAFRVTAYGFANIKHSFRNVANRFFVNAFLDSDPDTSLLRA